MMRERGMLKYSGFLAVLAVTVCVLMRFFAISSYGAEGEEASRRVYDQAGLFTETEIQEYETYIQQLRESLEMDLVLVTTEDAEGKTGQQYANDFYHDGAFGLGADYDGILFLIDLDNRELAFTTDGNAIQIFTDYRIDAMLDHVYQGASDGDYNASVEAFLQDVENYVQAGIMNDQYRYQEETGEIYVYRSIRWYEILLSLLVSGAVAGGACLNIKKEYAMEENERQLGQFHLAYRADARFSFQNETDQLINQFVTSRIIPRNTTRSTGSGSAGRRSDSGRSTVRRSSSGRSYGGGSRKF